MGKQGDSAACHEGAINDLLRSSGSLRQRFSAFWAALPDGPSWHIFAYFRSRSSLILTVVPFTQVDVHLRDICTAGNPACFLCSLERTGEDPEQSLAAEGSHASPQHALGLAP
jgi:hypothetical protein